MKKGIFLCSVCNTPHDNEELATKCCEKAKHLIGNIENNFKTLSNIYYQQTPSQNNEE